MAIRMKDIARRLKLSQTTVSHVLTGKHEHYRISPATVERVRKTARDLGYRSSALARAFRDRRSYSVSLAVEDLCNPFWTGIAKGAEREAEEKGYVLVVSNTSGDAEREKRVVQMLQEHRFDGLIVSPVTVADKALIDLQKEGRPFVQIDRSVKGADIPCVRTDHAAGSVLAVEHLLKRGHERIAFVVGPLSVQTYQYRLDGFKRAAAKLGKKATVTVLQNPSTADARTAVRALLEGPNRPTAIYTGNIYMTFGALRAIREAGLTIPKDLELVGFDDVEEADLLALPVTTVWQDVEAIGRESFRALLKMMSGEKAPRETLIAPKLRIR
jgi:LacI family transcriptional regulator